MYYTQWFECFGQYYPETRYEYLYDVTDEIDYSLLTVNLYFEEF